MRETTDIIQIGLFLSMVGVTLVTLVYPWSLRTSASRIWVHLPLSLLALYFAYEATMSPEMNIRIDLFLLWPMLGLAGLCYALKLLLLSARLSPESPDPSPGPLPVLTGAAPPTRLAEMDEANKNLAHLLPKPNEPPTT
jgi:hypothetical protein